MGSNGLSVERGLTTPDPTEAAIKRAMIGAARRAVLLADHTKAGNDYLIRFGEVADLDVIVTDAGMPDLVVEELEAAGPRVVRA
jgi:DeoR family transcriptional regulator, fructose operon transcriptional repressor